MLKPKLIIISGPTASGKTTLSIQLAKLWQAEIISFDSRQVYRELKIGVARPTVAELEAAAHHLIAHISLADNYSAQIFANDSAEILQRKGKEKQNYILVGGTGLYLNALMNGLDSLPDIHPDTRESVEQDYQKYGLEYLQNEVQRIDLLTYEIIDIYNYRRLQRVLEIWREHGQIYSQLIQQSKQGNSILKNFDVKSIVLDMPRTELYDRINQRVDDMIGLGLEDEVKSLEKFKNLNALQTVGYKEFFDYFEEKQSIEYTIDKIKQHTRNYAKRQITWNKKYRAQDLWVNPTDSNCLNTIAEYVHT